MKILIDKHSIEDAIAALDYAFNGRCDAMDPLIEALMLDAEISEIQKEQRYVLATKEAEKSLGYTTPNLCYTGEKGVIGNLSAFRTMSYAYRLDLLHDWIQALQEEYERTFAEPLPAHFCETPQ